MSEKKVAPLLPKWRNVGYAEFSASGKSVRLKIVPEYSCFAEYYYVGVESLRMLLEGRKKTATIYVVERVEDGKG